MKVILNEDVKYLGEMGDVKNVARGYYRNYLLPHMYAVPFNKETEAYFETKKAEIEARKEQKRADSKSLKEKLEAAEIVLTMPAGANGKLYGAVSSTTVQNYLAAQGYEIERKRIEVQGATIKNVGSYTVKIHLYETTVAEVKLSVKAQEAAEAKKESKKEEKKAAEAKNAEEAAE